MRDAGRPARPGSVAEGLKITPPLAISRAGVFVSGQPLAAAWSAAAIVHAAAPKNFAGAALTVLPARDIQPLGRKNHQATRLPLGRKRAIPDAELLDAAESVVRRDGAARLTLDAVAAEAGISKSSVLYAVGSKRGLIRAIIERRIDEWHGRCAVLEAALADRPNRTVEAVLEMIAEPLPQADRSVAVSLSAAVFTDETVREPIQRDVADRFARVARDAPAPTGATCAMLAIEGLLSLERFDLLQFEPDHRARLLSAIAWIAEQEPGEGRLGPRAATDQDDGAPSAGAQAPSGRRSQG